MFGPDRTLFFQSVWSCVLCLARMYSYSIFYGLVIRTSTYIYHTLYVELLMHRTQESGHLSFSHARITTFRPVDLTTRRVNRRCTFPQRPMQHFTSNIPKSYKLVTTCNGISTNQYCGCWRVDMLLSRQDYNISI